MEKINQLKGTVQQLKMERFVNELVIEDAKEVTGNTSVDEQFENAAKGSMAAITRVNRQLAIREPLLAELQLEWDSQQKTKQPKPAPKS